MDALLRPAIASGGGCICSAAIVTNSRAVSTIRPTVRWPRAATIRRERKVYAILSNPKRVRRLTAGITWPREKTTPSTNAGALGTGVICSIISSCCTAWLGMP